MISSVKHSHDFLCLADSHNQFNKNNFKGNVETWPGNPDVGRYICLLFDAQCCYFARLGDENAMKKKKMLSFVKNTYSNFCCSVAGPR